MQNAIPAGDDVAARIARRTLAAARDRLLRRGAPAARRRPRGHAPRRHHRRPRVADIVAAAGLSNDAFYRHFASKDALVAAILEDGAERLRSYLAHQMAKEPNARGQVRRWVEGVLAQAAERDRRHHAGGAVERREPGPCPHDPATGGRVAAGHAAARAVRRPRQRRPDLDAALVAHAVIGRLADHLWRHEPPTAAELDHLVRFCLAAVLPAPSGGRARKRATGSR